MTVDGMPTVEPVVTRDDGDQRPDDSLFGVPPSAFLQARALRGLALVGVAILMLLWPRRSDAVLAVLIGVALGVATVPVAYDLVRGRRPRTFLAMVGVGLASGLVASLLLQPERALAGAVREAGVILWVLAAVEIARMLRERTLSAWSVAKVVALGFAGVVLVTFPATLLAGATSVAAGLLAAAGLIEVFTDARRSAVEGAEEESEGRRTPWTAVREWISERPDAAEDRGTIQDKVYFEGEGSEVRYARFVMLMLFASVIASVGVVVESTAVVIGAMLIAPLMVPLMGVALGVTMGWPRRVRRCAGVAGSGVGLAVVVGSLVGAIVPRAVDVNQNSEILARTSPTTVDLAIAVAAGAAGAYALARRDVSDSLPGVAVAIALVPPLAVTGLCWQQGAWTEGNGAFLLFLTNAVAIIVAGGLTFVLVGAAPLERFSQAQARFATTVIGLLTLAGVVLMLLLLNGRELAQADLAQAGIQEVLTDWTDEHPRHRVADQRTLADGTVIIDLVGPGRPPDLEQLLDDLAGTVSAPTEVEVTWIDQRSRTVEGGG